MERTEWPSEKKLEDLRSAGIVPCSRFACAAAVGIVVMVGVTTLAERSMQLTMEIVRIMALPSEQWLEFARWRAVGKLLPGMFLLLPLLASGAALLVGMLQTRFLFSTSQICFDLGRCLPNRLWPTMLIKRGLVVILAGMLGVGAGAVLISMALRSTMSLLNQGRAYWLLWPGEISAIIVPIVVTMLVVSGVVAALLVRLQFLLKHRMTRAEMEQDAREEG